MITLFTLSLLCLAVILVLGVVLTILSVPFLVILACCPGFCASPPRSC